MSFSVRFELCHLVFGRIVSFSVYCVIRVRIVSFIVSFSVRIVSFSVGSNCVI